MATQLNLGEALSNQYAYGLSLIEEGVASMEPDDPQAGIGLRVAGQMLAEKAIQGWFEAARAVGQNGMLYLPGFEVDEAIEKYPRGQAWYLANQWKNSNN